MSLISVVVPVYKVEEYLHRCVKSIQSQTFQNLEIILVDDGSPDRCGQICDELAAQDSRIRVIHKENGGLSSARNAGIDAATGDYIGFVDSDDHIEPAMYERLLAALEESGADMSICNYAYVDEQNVADEKMLALSPLTDGVMSREDALMKLGEESLRHPFYVTAWNKLYKRKLFDDLRFPEGKLHEDEFTVHHLVARCGRVATVGEVLYRYVQRSGSIMSTKVSVRSLDGVYALLDRADFFWREGMLDTAKCVLASTQWKLGQMLKKLPKEAKNEAGKAVKQLMPILLRRRWKSALLLSWDWLQYLIH